MRRSKTAPPPPESRGNFTPPRSAASPAEPSMPAAESSGGKFAPRNWRVATKLNAILLIPVLVALLFGGFRVQASLETLGEAQDAERTAELVRAAAAYGHALLDERDRTAAPLLRGETDSAEVTEARKATDEAKDAFHAAADRAPKTASLNRRLSRFAEVEPKLEELRANAYTTKLKGVDTQLQYVEVQHPLMNLANELGLGTGNVTSYGRTVYAISLANAAQSLTRSIGTQLLVKPGPGAADKAEQVKAFSSYIYLENIALSEFFAAGTEDDGKRLRVDLEALQAKSQDELAKAKEQAEAAGQDFVSPPAMPVMAERIGSGLRPSALRDQGITAEVWYRATTGKFDTYRAIERDLADRAVQEAGDIAADAKREAIINSVIVLAALLIAFVVAGLMARGMSRSMNRLRNAAFDVAEQRLPMLVDQLSRTEPGKVDTQVKPIPIDTKDEIGEVARAFDQVHREAVRLAAEQALLRGNVNAIFTNLSSRNQGLIERQLDLITNLENNEADPDQLENLFKLDHLATRMRRNGENLLVLAGEEPGRRWTQPVPLVDVMRAAASEVESYERIEISGVPESEIHGAVVNDLVHLLAELLENATSFSSPQTNVKVTATRLPDGRVMIEIHDKGIGLTAEDFADINHKLADPPTVDAAISQRMGLYVVGRLADRHGIRVQLRPSGEQAGTTSLVMLPEVITHGGGGSETEGGDFTVSRIVPEQPQVEQRDEQPYLDHRSAAELGFDDSRYGSVQVPDDISSLDPVGRSPHREERRAAVGPESDGYGQDDQRPGADQQSGYESGYDQQSGYEAGYDQRSGYEQSGYGQDGGQGQDGYQDGGYDGYPADAYPSEGAAPDHGYDRSGEPGYTADAGYGQQADYQADSGYGPGYSAGGADQGHPGAGSGFDAFGQGTPSAGRPADGYTGQDGYGYQSQEPADGYAADQGDYRTSDYDATGPETVPGPRNGRPEAEAESGPVAPAGGGERVGFDRPGSSSSGSPSLTSAGLPRREKRGGRPEGSGQPQAQPQAESGDGGQQADSGSGDWRSANDERWERAEGVRAPKAGGVTTSGLPRRVPKANLVEGTAEQTPQGGPQVSRAPEDVRGRLSNLHRGVRRGRGGQGGKQNERPGFGTGSTYDQER
ncbi:nitrate- and nitrite sensing domain-containing protein [Streptomyces durbertensis]|uniref:histidine kinase n=1 Tax=Streptomyces durbertensis TaxID=2448886 RepID=A0ABR6EHL3_9ACTN|nr:nitrate- and nitrite sensing domain-containing protein [Streptomyces durbertensis]MBB1244004.1 nitrate- and nitrite sensing domain-containing protein [Streptomyces durbertensis]